MGLRLGLLVVLVLVWMPPLVAITQSATPVPMFEPAHLLDLAALTLQPTDLIDVGLSGFGLANQSSLREPETDAYLQAGGDPLETAERLDVDRETGLRARYVSSLLRPEEPLERLPSGLIAADQRISSAVAEYASVDDAATAFAIFEGPLDHEEGIDIPGTRPFGDESEITRSSATDSETGQPLQRLDPMAPWIEDGQVHDFYTHIYGRDEVEFAQLVTAIREGSAAPEPATPFAGDDPHPRHIYVFSSPVGEGAALDLPHYATWISLYASHEHAAADLQSLTLELGPGYADVRELPGVADEMSHPSRVFVYSYAAPSTPPVRGYVVITQVGNAVIRVLVDSPDGVRRAGVQAIAERQSACLLVAEECQPMPMEEATSLLSLGV
jgi:hypothetical protein